jgi:hypothetical protein
VKQISITTASKQRIKVLLVLSVIILIAVGVSYWTCNKALKAEANVRYSGMQSYVASELCRTIKGMELSAENVFNEVEKHLSSPDAVIAALESESNLNPDVRGYFAAFEPGYFSEKGRWFEPYVHHSDSSNFEMTQVGSARHDYTQSGWYLRAKNLKMPFWSDPYYYYDGTNISGHYCTYVKPVFDSTGKLACVCGADITFEWLSNELLNIDERCRKAKQVNIYRLKRNFEFFSVVFDKDGTCLVHPQDKNVAITDQEILGNLNNNVGGAFEMEIAGEPSVVYYGPIEGLDWTVAVIASKSDLQKPFTYMSIILAMIAVLGIIAVWLICRRIKYAEEA